MRAVAAGMNSTLKQFDHGLRVRSASTGKWDTGS
jgi:hypothetical protein